MNSVSAVEFEARFAVRQAMRERVADPESMSTRTAGELLISASQGLRPLVQLDRLLKQGEDLTFEETLEGMVYVLAASNHHFRELFGPAIKQAYGELVAGSPESDQSFIARGATFLQGMAMKEALSELTVEEAAALATGGLADCVVQLPLGEVVETCGMGGDEGFGSKFAEYKTINASTLAALVLAAMGVPTFKHGSGGNTAKLGSTEAAHELGLPIVFQDEAAILRYFQRHGFVYLTARLKTIHDMSTLTKLETVNHLIGPMSPPVTTHTKIHKVLGVNSKVKPSTVVQAYNLLNQKGVQSMGGIIAVCGLSEFVDPANIKDAQKLGILDELSPFSTLLAVGEGGQSFGSVLVTLDDFGAPLLTVEQLMVENTVEKVRDANLAALTGDNLHLASYLAANAALALVASQGLGPEFVADQTHRRRVLRDAYGQCLDAITSGKVAAFADACAADDDPGIVRYEDGR